MVPCSEVKQPSVGDALVAQEKFVGACLEGFAELGQRLGINLLVTVGADPLDGVSRQAGPVDQFVDGPAPAEALVLDVAAVVRQHLDFSGSLDGAGHRWRG